MPVTIPAGHACHAAWAEWVDALFIPTPSSVTAPTPAAAEPTGSIVISSGVARPKGTVQMEIGEKGVDSNYISFYAYQFYGGHTVPLIAQALAEQLRTSEEFQAFYSKEVAGASGIPAPVLTLAIQAAYVAAKAAKG